MEISEGAYTLLGVTLGALATQLSTWLSTRQADRRVSKEVLFFLLELHRLLATLDRLHRQLPALVSTLRQHLNVLPDDMDSALSNWMREMVEPLIGQQLTALKVGYDASLLKLAALDPVGAYRLRGVDEILQKMPQVVAAMQSTSAIHLGQSLPVTADMQAFFREHFEVQRVTDALSVVRSVMQDLAQHLGHRTRQALTAELVREQKKEQELPSKYATYMKKVKQKFQSPTI